MLLFEGKGTSYLVVDHLMYWLRQLRPWHKSDRLGEMRQMIGVMTKRLNALRISFWFDLNCHHEKIQDC